MEFKRPWELTAPESYALLHGPRGEYGTHAFKLALIELIARGNISLTKGEEGGFFKHTSILFLGACKTCRRPESRVLTVLLDLLDNTDGRTLPNSEVAVPMAKFVRAARKKYGWPGGYTEVEVMPVLAARGLCERQERRIWMPFGIWRWQTTSSGKRAVEALEDTMSLGYQRLREWMVDDQEQALRFLDFAGSAVLLMRSLHREVSGFLGERRESTGGPVQHALDETVPEQQRRDIERELNSLDEANFSSLNFPFYADVGTFDSLDSVFSAIDFGLTGGHDGGHSGHHGGTP